MGKKSGRGVSPIIASLLLVTIVLAGVFIVYPLVTSAVSQPIYSASTISYSLIKQGTYIVLALNVKNTGTGPLSLNCTIYDDANNLYQASPSPLALVPTATGAFAYESNSNGAHFQLGEDYRVIISDSKTGFYSQVDVICTGA
jgi:hypothetical protein